MQRRIETPRELPHPGELERGGRTNIGFEVIKVLVNEPEDEKNGKRTKSGGIPKEKLKGIPPHIVIVSLSGESNLKSVTNWMRKHMGAYPETWNGFFVKFIDTYNDNKGYKVEVCGEGEKGEKINGINYKISPYVFDIVDSVKKDNGKELRECFGGKSAEELKADDENRYFDRRDIQEDLSNGMDEILRDGDISEDK